MKLTTAIFCTLAVLSDVVWSDVIEISNLNDYHPNTQNPLGGTLREAIDLINAHPDVSYDLIFTKSGIIKLETSLTPILTQSTVTINGVRPMNVIIDGQGQHRAFFIDKKAGGTPSVTMRGMTIQNTTARGGSGGNGGGGGGGGAGLGGGMFIGAGVAVNLQDVSFVKTNVQGGVGGIGGLGKGGGGGGGLGGSGGHANVTADFGGAGGGGGFVGSGGHGGGTSGGGGGGLFGHGGGGGGSTVSTSGVSHGGGGGGGGKTGNGAGPIVISGGGGGGDIHNRFSGANAVAGFGATKNAGNGGSNGEDTLFTGGAANHGVSGGTGIGTGGGGGGGGAGGNPFIGNSGGRGGAGGAGGLFGGGGGGGSPGANANSESGGAGGRFGGGGGSALTANQNGDGGSGGEFGGGGGSGAALTDHTGRGGDGGFGGGGGGGSNIPYTSSGVGGNGGFGGGGGGNSGQGGYGGAHGSGVNGGNGAAFGGALFVQTDQTIGSQPLTLQNVTFSEAGVSAAAGASTGGNELFLMSGAHLIYNLNGSSVTFSHPIESDQRLYAGSATGGSVTFHGPGTLELNGNQTYVGALTVDKGATLIVKGTQAHDFGTTISSATFIALSDGSFGSQSAGLILDKGSVRMTGPLTSSRLLRINEGDNTIDLGGHAGRLSGALSGTGSLNKVGVGTLTLDGHSPHFMGNVIVRQDTLVANGNLASSSITVESGAKLKGTGTIGSLTSAGQIAPGNGIGTLTIGGDCTLKPGANLHAEINRISASQLNVAGDVTLGSGATVTVAPQPGRYTDGTLYPIVVAGGEVTGTFNHVSSVHPLFKFALEHDPGSVLLKLVSATVFGDIITDGNSAVMANHIDELGFDGRLTGDLLTVAAALDTLTSDPSELDYALGEMTAANFAALSLAQEQSSLLVRGAFTSRLQELYLHECLRTWYTNHRIDVWIQGVGEYANQDHKQGNAGWHTATGGVVLGADSRIGEHVYIGGGGGYTFTDINWNRSEGNGQINSYYGGLYGGWFNEDVFADLSLITSYDHYHTKRHIEFASIKRSARGSRDGYEFAGAFTLGMFYDHCHWRFEPFDRVDYIFTHQGKFKESGAGSLDLKVKEINSRFIRNELGLNYSYCLCRPWGTILPYGKLSWIFEKQLDHGVVRGRFSSAHGHIDVHGMHPTRNLGSPGLGIATTWLESGMTFSLYYEAEVGEKYWEQNARMSFDWSY